FLHGRRTFFEIIVFVENKCMVMPIPWFPIATPQNFRALVNQWPAKIAMVKQHMGSWRIAPVMNFVPNIEFRLPQNSGNPPSPFEVGAKCLGFPHHSGQAHFHYSGDRIRLDNGFKRCCKIADIAVQTPLTIGVRLGSTYMGQATGGYQSPSEGP